MSIGAIGASDPYRAADTSQKPQKPQGTEEITTVTTHCKKEHAHDQSCPHTVSTVPAPKAGEKGYLLDERA